MADKIVSALNILAGQMSDLSLHVGFIDGATYPDGTSVASVAAGNEYGIPEKKIPPRPFFRNAIAMHENDWKDLITRGLMADKPVSTVFEVAGATIAADVRGGIIQLMDPALSPVTIALRRNEKYRASVNKPVNTSTKPLEDTKTMLNDVTYEIRGANEST